MSTKIQRIIRLTPIYIMLTLAFNACANLAKAPTSEPQQTSPAEVSPGLQAPHAEVSPKVAPARPSFVHTVKWPGETLSHIAKWYTGEFKNWKMLAKANPGLDPNRIYKGNEIIIPEDVLKTRKPLPKDFLARSTPKPKKKRSFSKSSHQPKSENDLPLFGPKEYSASSLPGQEPHTSK